MKTLSTSLAALLIAAPAFAGPTADYTGCETVDMGGYLNFAEPGCITGHLAKTGNLGSADPAPAAEEEETADEGGSETGEGDTPEA